MQVDPSAIKTGELHAYLLGAVSPRPICFASTVDKNGLPNLSPFSFFNVFGANPPTLIFSPARRVRDNTTKHTLENIYATREVVINVVSYNMVHRLHWPAVNIRKVSMNLRNPVLQHYQSEKIKPFRVKESPVQMECIVREIIETGKEGGAGNLVICEPVMLHINDQVLDASGRIDPHKIDLVARMGGDYYCRASGNAVFEVPKPNTRLGIGVDALPLAIRNSHILSGNDLGQLANVHELPVVDPAFEDDHLKNIIQYYSITPEEMEKELHKHAKQLLEQGSISAAWQVLLSN